MLALQLSRVFMLFGYVTFIIKGGKGDLELAPKMADKTKQKIRTILSIALDKNHDSIILSGSLLVDKIVNCSFWMWSL